MNRFRSRLPGYGAPCETLCLISKHPPGPLPTKDRLSLSEKYNPSDNPDNVNNVSGIHTQPAYFTSIPKYGTGPD